MKRASLSLIALLCLSVTACGGDEASNPAEETDTTVADTVSSDGGAPDTIESDVGGEDVLPEDTGAGDDTLTPDVEADSGDEDAGPFCGNGVVEDGEACDDGNDDDTDECLSSCVDASCGDGIVQEALGEECDNGDDNSDTEPDACRSTCLDPSCGDAVVDTGEGCDDGNDDESDDCTSACSLASCGDGITTEPEECDDGNSNNIDECTNECRDATCGDGIVHRFLGEQCDDGAENSDSEPDACRTLCLNPDCGDGIVDSDEECDDGVNVGGYGGCEADCSASPYCGDGIIDEPFETCDDGINDGSYDTCDTDCTPASFCGDGIADTVGGFEECDDANDVDTDGCTNACTLPACGDGVVSPGEDCDDGNDVDTDACPNDCIITNCGNGELDEADGEECDDGNDITTDACTNACQNAECGDAIVWEGMEECDDGRNLGTYGTCTPACTLAPYCGDALTEPVFEDCDDGNDIDTDACRNDCSLPACGDSVVSDGEECDDGNDVDTDACTNSCTIAVCGDGVIQEGVETCDDGTNDASLGGCDTCERNVPANYAPCGEDGYCGAGVCASRTVEGDEPDEAGLNEFHYDDAGTDEGEFVEIIARGAQRDCEWDVVLYNGSDQMEYDAHTLTDAIELPEANLWLLELPTNGLQNGSPDGIYIGCDLTSTYIFYCYEGSFAAASGPAVGVECTPIVNEETNETPEGRSIGLTSGADRIGAFAEELMDATPGALNNGQTFTGGGSVTASYCTTSCADASECAEAPAEYAGTGVACEETDPGGPTCLLSCSDDVDCPDGALCLDGLCGY